MLELETVPEVELVSEREAELTAHREPEPVPWPAPLVARRWNLWEIETALHVQGESNEEKEFLLLYLRDYAGADGVLPPDFDGLVRESFGELLGALPG